MSTIAESGASAYDGALVILCPLLLLVASLWLFYRWQQTTRLHKLGNIIPGPRPLPIIGNALWLVGLNHSEIMSLSLKFHEQYGNVVRGWLGPLLFVFLMGAEDVEVILSSDVHIEKSSDYRFFEPWLGEGLLISSGDKWRSHRKMIAPTFHINILKSFMTIFNQKSVNIVNNMKSEMGKTFDVHDYMGRATVDILLETAMGITSKTQNNSGLDYAMAVINMCDIIHQRQCKFWMRLDTTFKLTSAFKKQIKLLNIIHGLTNKVIETKKKIYIENKAKGIIPTSIEELTQTKETNDLGLANDATPVVDAVFKGYRDDIDLEDENDIGEKKRLAFLDLLIESAQSGSNTISDKEIKEEVDTIMFEGHDTTAAGSSFVLSLLGIHQNIQEKVYEELYDIFGDSDRPATFSDTLRMKYLERVILETLRMYPPVPIIGRKLRHDVKIHTNNYVLPAGATVFIGTFRVHRQPEFFKNPNVFDPDNFLPENTQGRNYYSYIPFSAGPRSCVGRKYAILKLKVLLSTVLRNFKIVADVPEDKFVLQADIILKRTEGFPIKIEPRRRVPASV